MGIFRIYEPFNFFEFESDESQSQSRLVYADENAIQFENGDETTTYRGDFTYDWSGRLDGGTLQSIIGADGASVDYEFLRLDLEMSRFIELSGSGDVEALNSYIFAGSDRFDGSRFGDHLHGYTGNDLMFGNGGNDALDGGEGNDRLYGGTGRDWLDGGDGFDATFGGTGNDVYLVNETRDRVLERANEGADYVWSSASFVLRDNVEHLRLYGKAAITGVGNELANRMDGNGAANILNGRGGNDALHGQGGADRLEGGLGADHLYGEADADVFLFRSAAESVTGRARDVVRDFDQGVDRMHLAAIDADETLAGDQSFDWIGTAGFSGTAGELRLSRRVVEGDTDGDGVADFQIAILSNAGIAETDFLL